MVEHSAGGDAVNISFVYAKSYDAAAPLIHYHQNGEDAETLASHQEASAAKRLGLKLGLSVRKRGAVQWLRGYQFGYAAAKGEDVNQTSDEVGSALDSFCAENRDATLLEAAKELTPTVE